VWQLPVLLLATPFGPVLTFWGGLTVALSKDRRGRSTGAVLAVFGVALVAVTVAIWP
jgi:uncharacterized membrane protein YccC